MNSESKYQLIEDYLGEELGVAERNSFEKQLLEDNDFAAEVRLHEDIGKALAEEKVIRLENLLFEVRAEVAAGRNKTSGGGGKIVSLRRRYWAAAAAIALMIASFFVFRNYLLPPADLFAANYEPYPVYLNTRSDGAGARQAALGNGIKYYESKDYTAALPLFQEVLKNAPEDWAVLFYTGICQVETGRAAEAAATFQQVAAQGDNLYAAPAQWYRALALIKAGQTDQAKSALQEIVAGKGDFSTQAEKLLKRM